MTTPDFDEDLHVETTTIMFADVVESVRLIEQDELGNVARIRALLRRLSEDVVPKHQGTVLERRGDGLLIKFPDARLAAACAIELHVEAAKTDTDMSPAGSSRCALGCIGVMFWLTRARCMDEA